MEQVRFDSRTAEQASAKTESTAGYNLNVAKLDYSAKPILSRRMPRNHFAEKPAGLLSTAG